MQSEPLYFFSADSRRGHACRVGRWGVASADASRAFRCPAPSDAACSHLCFACQRGLLQAACILALFRVAREALCVLRRTAAFVTLAAWGAGDTPAGVGGLSARPPPSACSMRCFACQRGLFLLLECSFISRCARSACLLCGLLPLLSRLQRVALGFALARASRAFRCPAPSGSLVYSIRRGEGVGRTVLINSVNRTPAYGGLFGCCLLSAKPAALHPLPAE